MSSAHLVPCPVRVPACDIVRSLPTPSLSPFLPSLFRFVRISLGPVPHRLLFRPDAYPIIRRPGAGRPFLLLTLTVNFLRGQYVRNSTRKSHFFLYSIHIAFVDFIRSSKPTLFSFRERATRSPCLRYKLRSHSRMANLPLSQCVFPVRHSRLRY